MERTKITSEMVKEAVDTFAERYNKRQIAKACEMYSPFAILFDGGRRIMGHTSIIEELLSRIQDEDCITNQHVSAVNISCDGQRALAFIEFTIAHREKGEDDKSFSFPQRYCCTMFEVDNNHLYATASMSITCREC